MPGRRGSARICSGCAKFMEQGDSPNLAFHRGCFLHGALVEGPAARVGKSTPFPGRHLMLTAAAWSPTRRGPQPWGKRKMSVSVMETQVQWRGIRAEGRDPLRKLRSHL